MDTREILEALTKAEYDALDHAGRLTRPITDPPLGGSLGSIARRAGDARASAIITAQANTGVELVDCDDGCMCVRCIRRRQTSTTNDYKAKLARAARRRAEAAAALEQYHEGDRGKEAPGVA